MSNTILKDLLKRYPTLRQCENDIASTVQAWITSFEQGGKLLLCGNGGSAADAEHISGELLKGFCSKRPLSKKQRNGLPPELIGKLQNGLPAIPLSGFISLSSAFANDVDPTLIYAQLVWALGRKGDVLMGLSTSGNADNITKAFDVAKAKGITTIALTGASGGKLCSGGYCDICIRVPQKETYLIQELHLPVYHTICLIVESHFF